MNFPSVKLFKNINLASTQLDFAQNSYKPTYRVM